MSATKARNTVGGRAGVQMIRALVVEDWSGISECPERMLMRRGLVKCFRVGLTGIPRALRLDSLAAYDCQNLRGQVRVTGRSLELARCLWVTGLQFSHSAQREGHEISRLVLDGLPGYWSTHQIAWRCKPGTRATMPATWPRYHPCAFTTVGWRPFPAASLAWPRLSCPHRRGLSGPATTSTRATNMPRRADAYLAIALRGTPFERLSGGWKDTGADRPRVEVYLYDPFPMSMVVSRGMSRAVALGAGYAINVVPLGSSCARSVTSVPIRVWRGTHERGYGSQEGMCSVWVGLANEHGTSRTAPGVTRAKGVSAPWSATTVYRNRGEPRRDKCVDCVPIQRQFSRVPREDGLAGERATNRPACTILRPPALTHIRIT